MKCLIVEDDRVSCRVLEKMMSRFGSTDLVADGQQALELFRQAHRARAPYDLVLMDIIMPEVDGLQSVLDMRRIEALLEIPWPERAKVIMTTSLDDPHTVAQALLELDASSYLVKPISLKQLEDELRKLALIL